MPSETLSFLSPVNMTTTTDAEVIFPSSLTSSIKDTTYPPRSPPPPFHASDSTSPPYPTSPHSSHRISPHVSHYIADSTPGFFLNANLVGFSAAVRQIEATPHSIFSRLSYENCVGFPPSLGSAKISFRVELQQAAYSSRSTKENLFILDDFIIFCAMGGTPLLVTRCVSIGSIESLKTSDEVGVGVQASLKRKLQYLGRKSNRQKICTIRFRYLTAEDAGKCDGIIREKIAYLRNGAALSNQFILRNVAESFMRKTQQGWITLLFKHKLNSIIFIIKNRMRFIKYSAFNEWIQFINWRATALATIDSLKMKAILIVKAFLYRKIHENLWSFRSDLMLKSLNDAKQAYSDVAADVILNDKMDYAAYVVNLRKSLMYRVISIISRRIFACNFLYFREGVQYCFYMKMRENQRVFRLKRLETRQNLELLSKAFEALKIFYAHRPQFDALGDCMKRIFLKMKRRYFIQFLEITRMAKLTHLRGAVVVCSVLKMRVAREAWFLLENLRLSGIATRMHELHSICEDFSQVGLYFMNDIESIPIERGALYLKSSLAHQEKRMLKETFALLYKNSLQSAHRIRCYDIAMQKVAFHVENRMEFFFRSLKGFTQEAKLKEAQQNMERMKLVVSKLISRCTFVPIRGMIQEKRAFEEAEGLKLQAVKQLLVSASHIHALVRKSLISYAFTKVRYNVEFSRFLSATDDVLVIERFISYLSSLMMERKAACFLHWHYIAVLMPHPKLSHTPQSNLDVISLTHMSHEEDELAGRTSEFMEEEGMFVTGGDGSGYLGGVASKCEAHEYSTHTPYYPPIMELLGGATNEFEDAGGAQFAQEHSSDEMFGTPKSGWSADPVNTLEDRSNTHGGKVYVQQEDDSVHLLQGNTQKVGGIMYKREEGNAHTIESIAPITKNSTQTMEEPTHKQENRTQKIYAHEDRSSLLTDLEGSTHEGEPFLWKRGFFEGIGSADAASPISNMEGYAHEEEGSHTHKNYTQEDATFPLPYMKSYSHEGEGYAYKQNRKAGFTPWRNGLPFDSAHSFFFSEDEEGRNANGIKKEAGEDAANQRKEEGEEVEEDEEGEKKERIPSTKAVFEREEDVFELSYKAKGAAKLESTHKQSFGEFGSSNSLSI